MQLDFASPVRTERFIAPTFNSGKFRLATQDPCPSVRLDFRRPHASIGEEYSICLTVWRLVVSAQGPTMGCELPLTGQSDSGQLVVHGYAVLTRLASLDRAGRGVGDAVKGGRVGIVLTAGRVLEEFNCSRGTCTYIVHVCVNDVHKNNSRHLIR